MHSEDKRELDKDMVAKRARQLLAQKLQRQGMLSAGPLVALPTKRQIIETNYFAAQVCVSDLRPHTLAEGPGFQRWLAKRDLLCEARFKPRANDSSMVSQCLAQHEKAMWPLAAALLKSIDPCRRQSHQDCWTDVFKRHWIIGYESFLCPQTLRFLYLLYAFKDTGTYVELYYEKSKYSQGKYGATVQHRALDSAWRNHIGDVPKARKGVSDSADTAVAVTRKLGQAERRCVIHIVVIPERRLLTDPKEWLAEDKARAPPLPLHFEGVQDMRRLSLHYYRNTTTHKNYRNARGVVPGGERCTPPKPDTCKWESRHALLEHCKEDSPEWKVLEQDEKNNKYVKAQQPELPNGALLPCVRLHQCLNLWQPLCLSCKAMMRTWLSSGQQLPG